MPHVAAVDRQDSAMAKSASPSRVRQAPPEPRCWTLTGRMVHRAWLLLKMSRSGRVAKRRIGSSKVPNLRRGGGRVSR
jgi:hypothetical protein